MTAGQIERDGSPCPWVDGYVYGAGLESMVTANGTYYYLADGLGSTMAIVDTSGAVQKSYTYDIYGKPTPTGSLANEFDFAGQQTDGSTGLQYLRARYYDVETGRFISRDPMARAAPWLENAYAYGSASPTNMTDPAGLCSWYNVICHAESGLSEALTAARAAAASIAQAGTWTAEQAAAIARAAAELAKGAWNAMFWPSIRYLVNLPVTMMALATFRDGLGLKCEYRGSGGMIACYGAHFLSGSAMTLGNVILVKEYEISDELLEHETVHADQWARFGLATLPDPMIGQSVFAASYGALRWLQGACNTYEAQAGYENGGYAQCLGQ